MAGPTIPIRRARMVRALASGLWATVLALAPAGAPAAEAARQTTLIVSFYADGTHGDGKGTVTADVGNINCSFDTGFTSGTCQHTYVYLDAYPLDVELTYTPATGSYVCMVGATVCHPGGSVQKQLIRLDGQTSTTFNPSFNRRSFTVQVDIDGPGTIGVNGSICTPTAPFDLCRSFKYGTTATLTPTPSSGSNFAHWLGTECATATAQCSFTVTGPVGLGAVFGKWYVSAEAQGSGDVCATSGGTLCTEGLQPPSAANWITSGSTLVLEARPKPGFGFTGWQAGPCAGQPATCSFVVSANASLIARFAQIATPTPVPTATPKPPATASPKPAATAGPTASTIPTAGPTTSAAPGDPATSAGSTTPPPSPAPATAPPPTDGATTPPDDDMTETPAATPAATPAPSADPIASPAVGTGVLLPALVIGILAVAVGAFLAGRRSRRTA